MRSTTITELPLVTANDGAIIRSFELSNSSGIVVVLSSVGASIQSILVPNYSSTGEHGIPSNVVLGYSSPKDMYETNNPAYMGVIVGRVANRIERGQFELNNGTRYALDTNNGPNHLHGGRVGFSHAIWDVAVNDDDQTVVFTHFSPNGDQGYPASIVVTATYSLVTLQEEHGAKLVLTMTGKLVNDTANDKDDDNEDQPVLSTPINLAQHSYFNLSGIESPNSFSKQLIQLPHYYSPNDVNSIPTREVCPIPSSLQVDGPGITMANAIYHWAVDACHVPTNDVALALEHQVPCPIGIDHNFVVMDDGVAGIISCPMTHRKVTVRTSAPGVQIYTANWLDIAVHDEQQRTYKPWQGICLETQHYPNSIMNDTECEQFPEFAKGKCFILTPGGPDYYHQVEYQFEPM